MRGAGGSACASYTEKGCPKNCPQHSLNQGCFSVLNHISKSLLLWIRDFWCPRDSQGLFYKVTFFLSGVITFNLIEVLHSGCVSQSCLQVRSGVGCE